MTEGRKSSGFSVDSKVFLTMVSGGFRLRKPGGAKMEGRVRGGVEGIHRHVNSTRYIVVWFEKIKLKTHFSYSI